MTEPLAVLFEDPHCLAVAKPAGVPAQGPPALETTLEAAVRQYLRPGDPGSVYLGTVHRLDRPVSGVVVWAKTPKAARRLADQFARREAAKEYWAIVAGPGIPGVGEEGSWDDWLSPSTESGLVRVVDPGTPGGRRAITRFRKGQAAQLPEGSAWLRLWPETGRTHQLRVQAASRGLAIVGDSAYGSSRSFPVGIALHARALRVVHPITRQAVVWIAPVPVDWRGQGIELPETTVFGS